MPRARNTLTTATTTTAAELPAELVVGFTLDLSDRTGVVVCDDCRWRGLVVGGDPHARRLSAWRQAAAHERRAHSGRSVARAALRELARREAARELAQMATAERGNIPTQHAVGASMPAERATGAVDSLLWDSETPSD